MKVGRPVSATEAELSSFHDKVDKEIREKEEGKMPSVSSLGKWVKALVTLSERKCGKRGKCGSRQGREEIERLDWILLSLGLNLSI